VLVIIGATADGRKHVLAVESGYRESTESWAEVLGDLKARGLNCPGLTVADGHLGIWAALARICPESREQRCWNHKMRNVLDCLPKRERKQAKALLLEMFFSSTRKGCKSVRTDFERRFRKHHPRAVDRLNRDWERMVTFYDFPKDHWRHLRTTNIVESPFAAVRLRTKAAKRYKRSVNATAVIWKILMLQEKRFRRLLGWMKLIDVYRGTTYRDGIPVNKPTAQHLT
jgi:putative transposase